MLNVCFSTNTVPAAWKTICIVPVPKRPVILSLDDLCHVALTAAVMKVCVRVVLCKLDSLVKNYSDPLQFANRRNRSTVDAVLYVLENINLHLEKNREFCMTDVLPVPVPLIQSHSHVQKLSDMKLPSSVISWIFDYPTKRLQYVWLSGALSSVICTNTGAPLGTVLAPFLFSLYKADCRSTDELWSVGKFADDTELVAKISNDEDALYHKQIENLWIGVIKITCIWMFLKLKRCVLTLGRIKDVLSQSTLKEMHWRG